MATPAALRQGMFAVRTSFRQLPRASRRTVPRRFASDHGRGHASHAHTGPTSERFGPSFYYTLLLIPAGYFLYIASVGSTEKDGGIVGRAIRAYGDLRQEWVDRNALHTKMVEQAGHDRNLFFNARMPNHIDLKAPEMVFGTGSPYNVPAGHSVNLEKVMAHYRDQNAKEEEAKIAKLQEQAKK